MTTTETSLKLEFARIKRENDMLRDFIGASRDALWCIEFAEPVDLTAPEAEIIRQVFENECYWRLCNTAMARLYKLPEDQDFNAQNVRFVFPRNPENEDFVRQLIANDFNIDGAPSLDQTYEGEWIHAANDVRADIENGGLHRMWGAVRNLTQQRRLEKELTERLESLVNVLSAVPDPVLVIGSNGNLLAANPALEWVFGWNVDNVLGRPAKELLTFKDGAVSADDVPVAGERALVVPVSVVSNAGRVTECEAFVSSYDTPDRDRQMVVTLRGYGTAAPVVAAGAG